MKLNKNFLFNISLALLVASLVVSFSGAGVLERFRLNGLDFLFRLRGTSAYNPHVIIVEINEDNISKVGRWPWNREWFATVSVALKELGAKYTYFDVIFSEPSTQADRKDDKVFAEAIKKTDNVYLPFAFQEYSIDIESALFPVEEFSAGISGCGPVNIYPDLDGALRKIPLYFDLYGYIYPHVVLKLAMDYMGMGIDRIGPDFIVISNPQEEIKIPLVDGNKLIINWSGNWKDTFTHYSFLDVLMAYKNSIAGDPPGIDIKPFKDSICLVAVTAIGLHDIKPTSVDPEHPGIGIMATALSNILDRKLIKACPFRLNLLFIFILALIPPIFISGEKPLRGVFIVILAGVIFFGAVVYLFGKNCWIDYTLPLLTLVASYLSVATFRFIRVAVERQRFMQLSVTDGLTGLTNIMSFKVTLKSECAQGRITHHHRFCVLMTDIDHFKDFNDTYGHAVGDLVLKELADVLKNSVRAADVVARYGGEEMVILLRNASLDNGMSVAEKIRENVESHVIRDENGTYKATISLGVARFHHQDDENMIIKRADAGLYKAKNMGRNRVETIEF